MVLPALDFSTIRNELFPIVAAVFSKTNSLAIKVRGLQSFVILCGGSNNGPTGDDGLSGLTQEKKKTSSSTALDKYTMQEKIVPLIKVIKTKEPAVMMASLNVLGIVGDVADAEFVAMDILPILWSMSLGPLLDLKQFQAFMSLIKTLSRRVEDEQTRKLQELAGTSNGATAAPNEDFLAFGGVTGTAFDSAANGATADDFEALVKGKASAGSPNPGSNGFASWDAPQANPVVAAARSPASPQAPAFAWSTQTPVSPAASAGRSSFSQQQQQQQASFRTVTPDLARFEPMAPSSTQYSQPLQPSSSGFAQPASTTTMQSTSLNWGSAAAAAAPNPWSSPSGPSTPNYGGMGAGVGASGSMASSMASMSMGGNQPQRPSLPNQSSSFSLPPPPGGGASKPAAFGGMQSSSASTWANSGSGGTMGGMMAQQQQRTMSGGGGGGGGGGMGVVNTTSSGVNANARATGQSKSGLDKYQSLI